MYLLLSAIMFLCLTLGCDADVGSVHGATYLLADSGYKVTTYQTHVHARSKIDCIRTCRGFSNCTSFVFEKSSSDCYLNPSITSGGNNAVHLYAGSEESPAAPVCDLRSGFPLGNGTVTVWRQSLTGAEGVITCDQDFMATSVSGRITIRCTDNGPWEMYGECLQYIFRNPVNPLQPFQIPRPVQEGWGVCIEGTPTANIRFGISIATPEDSTALTFDNRFSYLGFNKTTILTKRQGSTYEKDFNLSENFPFLVNQTFTIQITLKTNNTFEISVNGRIYTNFTSTTSPRPLEATFVRLVGNVNLKLINLWCAS